MLNTGATINGKGGIQNEREGPPAVSVITAWEWANGRGLFFFQLSGLNLELMSRKK